MCAHYALQFAALGPVSVPYPLPDSNPERAKVRQEAEDIAHLESCTDEDCIHCYVLKAKGYQQKANGLWSSPPRT
jgi:hypothetical protein